MLIYPKELLNKPLPYQKYTHKKTGMKVAAVRYKEGMEDGWKEFPKIKGKRPYLIICYDGFIQKIMMHDKLFIVKYKDYRFVFEAKYFLKTYRWSE